jgi:hypothetical protein
VSHPACSVGPSGAIIPGVTEQAGQRGEVETGTNSTDSRAETSQDEADELAGPDEQSGYEGDSGSSSGSSSDSGSSDSGASGGSSDSDSSSQQQSEGSEKQESEQDSGEQDSGEQDSGEQDSGEQDSGTSGGSHGSQQGQQQGQQEGRQQAQEQGRTQTQNRAQGAEGTMSAPHGREQRTPVDVGELVWKVASVLASVVRVVAYVLAAVLVAYIVLTIVGVNTANGVARVIGSVGNTAVGPFRDLFLLSDPLFTVIVDYGLAAVFWILLAEFGSRFIRWLGARLS